MGRGLLRGCNNCSAITFQNVIIKKSYAEIMILCSLLGGYPFGGTACFHVKGYRGINLQEFSVSFRKTTYTIVKS